MSEIDRKEVPIGESVFYIRRFPPFIALEMLGDLQKQFAGPLLAALDGKEGASEEENRAALMAGFSKLSASMDGKTLRALAQRLLDKECISVSINGAEPRKLDDAAVALSMRTSADVLQLCWAVITHNWAEVLSRLASPTGPAAAFLKANPSANSALNSLRS